MSFKTHTQLLSRVYDVMERSDLPTEVLNFSCFLILFGKLLNSLIPIFTIIIRSFYSSVEHRAEVRVSHLVLFAANTFASAQLFFFGFNLFSTVSRRVVLGCPLFLVPCGLHSIAALVISLRGFLSVCAIHFQFQFFFFFLLFFPPC
jgi:hypothetical protein